MKATQHIRPAQSLADLVANDNNSNTTRMIVSLLETMPLPDRAALGPIVFGEQAARMQAATPDEIIDRLPAAVLRSARDRKLTDARLHLKELDERCRGSG